MHVKTGEQQRIGQVDRIARQGEHPVHHQRRGVAMRNDGGAGQEHLPRGNEHHDERDQNERRADDAVEA